jgi:hypothetical protein
VQITGPILWQRLLAALETWQAFIDPEHPHDFGIDRKMILETTQQFGPKLTLEQFEHEPSPAAVRSAPGPRLPASGGTCSEPGIDGFALHGENAKDAFVHAAKWFLPDEPF